MRTWNAFPRVAVVTSLLVVLCAGMFAPRVGDVETASAKPVMVYPATSVVISEFRFRGDGGGNDEFIELYNPTGVSIDISGWLIRGSNNIGTNSTRATIPMSTILQPGQYYLVAHSGYTGSGTVDLSYGTGITDDGGVALTLADTTTVIDQVGLSGGSFYLEGSPLPPLTTNVDRGYERRIGGANGNCQDDDNNQTDFFLVSSNNPQGLGSPFVSCGAPTATPSSTNTPTNTSTPTNTNTPTNTPIFSLTPSLTPAPGEIIISEVAWSGTNASPDDEWIELYNTRPWDVNLTGWRLTNSTGSVDILLNDTISANGFLLLERGSDQTVSDIPADATYFGALADINDFLRLRKPDGTIVDTANANGGAWSAGGGANNASMERYLNGSVAAPDNDFGWLTNSGILRNGLDAAGNPIYGTPGSGNYSFIVTVTPTFTSTLSPTPTITATPSGVRSVIINEIAWAGTASGLADDEWIELYNPSSTAIDITDWVLKATDGSPAITLDGIIPAGGYFLLERGATTTDDSTVSDIAADQIYTGSALSNNGEALQLVDTSNKVIDTANGNGGAWPRGSSSTFGTMERIANTADSDTAWVTNTGSPRNGKNANGGDILGTPKRANTIGPTPTPGRTPTPTRTLPPPTAVIDPRPIINEILPRPGYDWNQDGKVDVFDEFIEIKNLTAIEISLNGWKLSTVDGDSFTLPNVNLAPSERIVFYGSATNILLSDGGETVRLSNPNGKIYDAYTYAIAREEDRSICRLPDGNPGSRSWFEDCIPTPNLTNSREGNVPSVPGGNAESPVCDLPDTIPADFFFAECRGYGAGIWNPIFWDATGWMDKQFLPSANSKWRSFIE